MFKYVFKSPFVLPIMFSTGSEQVHKKVIFILGLSEGIVFLAFIILALKNPGLLLHLIWGFWIFLFIKDLSIGKILKLLLKDNVQITKVLTGGAGFRFLMMKYGAMLIYVAAFLFLLGRRSHITEFILALSVVVFLVSSEIDKKALAASGL